jgi:hypothetical protein
MAKKQERQVFHSIQSKKGWQVERNKRVVSHHERQTEAEAAAIEAAKAVYDNGGLGQAVLHKANGEIREERTYGKDPERTPG